MPRMHLTDFSVEMPDGENPLTQEEQSEYLLWKNVFSAVRHGRRNEVLDGWPCQMILISF
jgi:hypothetical protein